MTNHRIKNKSNILNLKTWSKILKIKYKIDKKEGYLSEKIICFSENKKNAITLIESFIEQKIKSIKNATKISYKSLPLKEEKEIKAENQLKVFSIIEDMDFSQFEQ